MQGATYTNPRPGQYLMHTHSHIKREVAATYSCLALIGAHQRDKAVRLMSGGHPRLKNPYRRGEGKAVYPGPASHNTRGTCWMGTAQQFYHDELNTETHSISGHVSHDFRPYFVMSTLTWRGNINSSINVWRTNLIIFQFSPRQNKLNQSKTIRLQQNYITFDQT